MSQLPVTDIHQHLWPERLLEALRARSEPPYLRGWTLHTATEAPYAVRPDDHDPHRRAALDPQIDRIVLAPSAPLGIENLPPDDAHPLLDGWHRGIHDLGAPFCGWAAVSSIEPDLEGLKDLLGGGVLVGLQVPASQIATPALLEELAPVLARCEELDRPVLVHPGPAQPAHAPIWWPAVVDYTSQMHAAWWSWFAAGRPLFPRLRICFAAGAGLAPVHHERLFQRRGGPLVIDPLVFVETSSYGRQGVDALVRALGIDAVVLGSDRPYAVPLDPGQGAAAWRQISRNNPQQLLEGALR